MTLQGQDIIRATSKTLPKQPGVYQMEDSKGNILYIGKAKNLANRSSGDGKLSRGNRIFL